ncbi:MAG TPA: hypothetical protein VGH93_11940 [Solirubrobacteraceae bacterium]
MVHPSPERAPSALDGVLRRAGAIYAQRQGQSVAVSYGSPAGELAACVAAAGIADSSHLTKLEVRGSAGRLAELIRHVTDGTLAPGGLLHAAGAWWCGAGGASSPLSPERVIVISGPEAGGRLCELLGARAARTPGLAVQDRSQDWAAITIIGTATPDILESLGVFGPDVDPLKVAPFTSAELADVEALWLLKSEHRALALVPSGAAIGAWHAIERAGRAWRICCVGQDAIARFELLQRCAAIAEPA